MNYIKQTAQEAAFDILNEMQRPLPSREIARIALDHELVSSRAQDPVQSIAMTIEKNIRERERNKPRLEFIEINSGRLIGLPSMRSEDDPQGQINNKKMELKAFIPARLHHRLQLASHAQIAQSDEETIGKVLDAGLTVLSPLIMKNIQSQLGGDTAQENHEWAQMALVQAMRGIDDDNEPEYRLEDIKKNRR